MKDVLKIFKNRNSIISRIIINLFIFISLFLLSIIMINYNLTKKNYDKIEQEKIDIILNSIKPSLAVNISFELWSAVEDTLDNLVKNKDIIRVKLDTPNDSNKKEFYNSKREKLVINGSNSFSKTIEIFDPQSKEGLARLTIIYSKDNFNRLINEYLLWIGILTIIYIIVSLFFIKSVSFLIKPLDDIAHDMNNFDPSNPQKIINKSHCKDEIDMIYKSSNKMIDTIDNHIKDMEKKNKLIFEQSKMASMGEMIGNIAHQWRQPLSVISTGATGMKVQKEFDTLSDESFQKTCTIINENAQYLSKTIDDFRNFIKGDRDKKVFSLNKMIDSFLNLVQGPIKNNNIQMKLDLEEELHLEGYENELIQCLINIFNNAKDVLKELTQEKRYIFITSKSINNKVIISIKDNANGIPNDILPKIFEPYFTTKHKSQGTGLGLHMTYNLIVDGMNGNIEVKNDRYLFQDKEYTGAEFTITLPTK